MTYDPVTRASITAVSQLHLSQRAAALGVASEQMDTPL